MHYLNYPGMMSRIDFFSVCDFRAKQRPRYTTQFEKSGLADFHLEFSVLQRHQVCHGPLGQLGDPVAAPEPFMVDNTYNRTKPRRLPRDALRCARRAQAAGGGSGGNS